MKVKEDKEKSPVTIRYKALKNGNQSIYLDCYLGNGQREYKFLNLYLRPGKSKEDKEWNRSQMELATAIKSQNLSGAKMRITGRQMSVTQKPAPVGLPADFIPPRSLQIALPRSRGSLSQSRGRSASASNAAVNAPPARSSA